MRPIQASVLSALVIGCVAGPSAHADATFGPGYYAVPGQLPYGVYTAGGDSVTPNNSLAANILAPAVAKFITHGCTPWTKAD